MPQQVIHPSPHWRSASFESDRKLLQEIFQKSGWRLLEARDRRLALRLLEHNPVHVVIAESELPNWGWKKILSDLRRLAHPPQLIVTSRTADDHLWAEVLQYRRIRRSAAALERDEVERVVAAAGGRTNPPGACRLLHTALRRRLSPNASENLIHALSLSARRWISPAGQDFTCSPPITPFSEAACRALSNVPSVTIRHSI